MSRYYESNSDKEIRPGKISKELRDALNIADNDVPIWIYRMRALGYPPGWLSKAIVDTSDIFDTDELGDASSNKRKSPSDEIQYDHSKLIEYPGFNTPMPPNCNDYHYYINMPPMLNHQQLDYAKQHMSAFNPAPLPSRTSLLDTSTVSTLDSSNSESNQNKGSLDESAKNSSPDDKQQIDDQPRSKKVKSEVSQPQDDGIKLLSKGSPMPKLVQRAPLEKFSEGVVGELLYFENLPESTGKFESIRGLLNTIRKSKSETNLQLNKSM